MGNPIRVLLVDGFAVFREAFAFMLAREPDLAVAGAVGTIDAALTLLRGIDVAIIELDLPDGDSAELIRAIHSSEPAARILILTRDDDRAAPAPAVEAGATAALHKSCTLDEVIGAVRR